MFLQLSAHPDVLGNLFQFRPTTHTASCVCDASFPHPVHNDYCSLQVFSNFLIRTVVAVEFFDPRHILMVIGHYCDLPKYCYRNKHHTCQHLWLWCTCIFRWCSRTKTTVLIMLQLLWYAVTAAMFNSFSWCYQIAIVSMWSKTENIFW